MSVNCSIMRSCILLEIQIFHATELLQPTHNGYSLKYLYHVRVPHEEFNILVHKIQRDRDRDRDSSMNIFTNLSVHAVKHVDFLTNYITQQVCTR
jgi:hypothetical protein